MKKLLVTAILLNSWVTSYAGSPTYINLKAEEGPRTRGVEAADALSRSAPESGTVVVSHPPLEKKKLLFFPDMPLGLGRVFAGNDILGPKLPCFEIAEEQPIRKNLAATSLLTMEVVSSREDLLQSLSISPSIAAQMKLADKGYKAQFKLDWVDTKTFSSDTLTLLVKVDSTYGTYQLSDYKLRQDYIAAIKSNNFNYLNAKCGDMFVISELRRGVVAVILTIRNVSNTEKRKIDLSVGGGMSFGLGEVDVNVDMGKTVSQAKNEGRVSLDFYSSVGTGMDQMKEMISKTGSGLQGVTDALGDYVSKIEAKSIPPSILYVAPIEMAFPLELSEIRVPRDYRVIDDSIWETLYFQHSAVEATIRRLKKELQNTMLPANILQYYRQQQTTYEQRKNILEEVAQKLAEFRRKAVNSVETVIPADLTPVAWFRYDSDITNPSFKWTCDKTGKLCGDLSQKPAWFGFGSNWTMSLGFTGQLTKAPNVRKVELIAIPPKARAQTIASTIIQNGVNSFKLQTVNYSPEQNSEVFKQIYVPEVSYFIKLTFPDNSQKLIELNPPQKPKI